MKVIAGAINKQWLFSLAKTHTSNCDEVRTAVAYAEQNCLELFLECRQHRKALTFYGRYDLKVPVDPEVVRWFLDQRDPTLVCRMVPDFLHSKVIWWLGVGAFLSSANLTNRAWTQNLGAGIFMSEDELDEAGMLEDLRTFFDVVDARSHAIDDGLYRHLVELEGKRQAIDKVEDDYQRGVERYYPAGVGLASEEATPAKERAYAAFVQRWRESLQILRDISQLVVRDEHRPSWIPPNTPAGAQADQFVHAYYYKKAHGHRGDAHVRAAYERNRPRGTEALTEALLWWKRADFDFDHERRTLLEWAPTLRRLLSKDHIRFLTQDEFKEARSMVHSVIDYGNKRRNVELGLQDDEKPDQATRVMLWAERLWHARTSQHEHTPVQMLEHVIWGEGDVESRIWTASREPQWRIRGLNFSSLGEMVGWARPDEYPPRNDRTIKGLTCLGYTVRSV